MPSLSSLSSEKIANDTKYRKSARALLSVMAFSNKISDLLTVNSEGKDLAVVTRLMKEATTVCGTMLQTLGPATYKP